MALSPPVFLRPPLRQQQPDSDVGACSIDHPTIVLARMPAECARVWGKAGTRYLCFLFNGLTMFCVGDLPCANLDPSGFRIPAEDSRSAVVFPRQVAVRRTCGHTVPRPPADVPAGRAADDNFRIWPNTEIVPKRLHRPKPPAGRSRTKPGTTAMRPA